LNRHGVPVLPPTNIKETDMISRKARLSAASALSAVVIASTAAGMAHAATIQRSHGFAVDCQFSHTASVDPIVMPGMTGMSHQHEFFGNSSTDENSTGDTLLAASTTCNDPNDLSSYWVPSLLWNGTRVQPVAMHVNYKAGPGQVTAFPAGFKAVTGRTDTTAAWVCATPGTPPVMGTSVGTVPTCSAGQHLVARIIFGSCWDGTSLDSANHASHLVAAVSGACPSDHAVVVPQVSLDVNYPAYVTGGSAVTLSSGAASTLHGDIFEAWVGDSLSARLTAPAPTGTQGPTPRPRPSGAPVPSGTPQPHGPRPAATSS